MWISKKQFILQERIMQNQNDRINILEQNVIMLNEKLIRLQDEFIKTRTGIYKLIQGNHPLVGDDGIKRKY